MYRERVSSLSERKTREDSSVQGRFDLSLGDSRRCGRIAVPSPSTVYQFNSFVTTARLLNAKAPRHSETSGITTSQPERLESFATPLREPRISHGNYHLHHVRLFTFQRHFRNCLPLFIPLLYLLTEKSGSSGEHFWHAFGRCPVRMSATTVTS